MMTVRVENTAVRLVALLMLSCLSPVLSTDLAVVYKHDIILLRDADKVTPDTPLSWESHILPLPKPLYYPSGLTQDSNTNTLFVSEEIAQNEGKIFSISLNSEYAVESMIPIVKSSSSNSMIEGMSYNPKSRLLYWTDASHHGIFEAPVPTGQKEVSVESQLLRNLGEKVEPRGLAFDHCNECLYWSKSTSTGAVSAVSSSIEMWDFEKNKHQVIQQDKEKSYHYQGLTFDSIRGNLLWVVTRGNDNNSTCRIVTSPVNKEEEHDLVNLENCLPFTLAIDEEYVYWSDWHRHGVMRASLTDSTDVVKLINTPKVITKWGQHLGAYGLAALNVKTEEQFSCLGKQMEKSLYDSSEDLSSELPRVAVAPKNSKEEDKDEVVDSESNVPPQEPVPSKNNEEEHEDKASLESNVPPQEPVPSKNNEEEHTEANSGSNVPPQEPSPSKNKEEEYEDEIVKSASSALPKDTAMPKNNEGEYKDEIVKAVSNVFPSLAAGSEAESGLSKGVPISNNKTKSDSYAQRLSGNERCPGAQQGTIIIVLAVLCAVLFVSTNVLLLVLFRLRKNQSSKATSPGTVIAQPSRQVKRFGPKKQNVFGNKSGLMGSSCSDPSKSDGVTINIEDCCQMTLCETPCYTSVKKQGKGYKHFKGSAKKCEDKTGLLDDCQDV